MSNALSEPLRPRFPADGRMRGSVFAIHDLGVQSAPEQRFAG